MQMRILLLLVLALSLQGFNELSRPQAAGGFPLCVNHNTPVRSELRNPAYNGPIHPMSAHTATFFQGIM